MKKMQYKYTLMKHIVLTLGKFYNFKRTLNYLIIN